MDISQLIRSECDLVQTFVALLGEEQGALSAGNADALSDITPKKTALIVRLNGIAEARNRALSVQGFPTDQAGLTAWCKALGPEAKALRERLLTLAAEARELNRLNGQLINMRMQAARAALDVLGGSDRTHKSTYGKDGQATSPKTGYRFIDSA